MRLTAKPARLSFIFLLVLAPLYFSSSSPVSAGLEQDFPIALVGLDRAGNEIANVVPAEAYTESLALAFSAVHKSALPTLAARREAPAEIRTWRLRTLGVGVGLTGTLGLGPIVTLSASPRLILVFTNSKHPIYPN